MRIKKGKYVFILLFLAGLVACAPQEPPEAIEEVEGVGTVFRADPALDSIVSSSAKIEKLADGFTFTEGPIWVHDGYLLFSDIPNNVIRKWTADGGVTEFLQPSGYDGTDAPEGYIGSNGLTLDAEGRLIVCQHGNRRIIRSEEDGSSTVLVDKFKGKRLNSPNDLVYHSDGSLYFTDPPYGLLKQDEDPAKELDFNGIYRLEAGKLQLLSKELTRPNGLGLSPDEQQLYVANSDPDRKIWMRYDVQPDGSLANGRVFYDASGETEDGLPDGLKVDQAGNLYCTGPGGVWVFSPEGKHLGTIKPPETPANCAWGGADGKTLYMTAVTGLYRIKLNVAGIRP